MRRALVTLTICLLAAGCRGEGPRTPTSTTTPPVTSAADVRPLPEPGQDATTQDDDRSYGVSPDDLAAATLTPTDIPGPWNEQGAVAVAQTVVPGCTSRLSDAHRTDPDGFSPLTASGSTLVSANADTFVTSAVAAYWDEGLARTDREVTLSSPVQDCLLREFVESLEGNPDFSSYQVADYERRDLGRELIGATAKGQIYTVVLTGGGGGLILSSATVVVGNGTLNATIGVVGFGAFDTSFLGDAVRNLERKLAGVQVEQSSTRD